MRISAKLKVKLYTQEQNYENSDISAIHILTPKEQSISPSLIFKGRNIKNTRKPHTVSYFLKFRYMYSMTQR